MLSLIAGSTARAERTPSSTERLDALLGTPTPLFLWAAGKPRGERVGLARCAWDCPVYNFLKENGLEVYSVHRFQVLMGSSLDSVVTLDLRRRYRWLRALIAAVDSSKGPITARQLSLYLLRLVVAADEPRGWRSLLGLQA